MPEIVMTQAQFARHLGVSAAMVSKHKRNGRLITDAKGLVLVQETLSRIAATADPSRPRQPPGSAAPAAADGNSGGSQSPGMEERTAITYQQARAVKERYGALQAKAEHEKFIGKLVEADAARAAGAELGVLFRNALETWPDRLAPVLAAEREEGVVRTLLAEHAEALLLQLENHIARLLEGEQA